MSLKPIQTLVFSLLILTIFSKCASKIAEGKEDDSVVGEYEAKMTDAPAVPASANYKYPEKVIVKLEVLEHVMRLADGVE